MAARYGLSSDSQIARTVPWVADVENRAIPAASSCARCHSGVKRKAGLDVTSYDSLLKFVKAGNPDRSKLHQAITGQGAKQMPPKNPLSEEQIAVITAWIEAGAKKD